jgi:hypothetical protein
VVIEVGGGGGWIDQSADCPEAEARHGQTGNDRGGLRLQDNRQTSVVNHPPRSPPRSTTQINYDLEVGGGGGWIDQSADCPEAEARHGQTGNG